MICKHFIHVHMPRTGGSLFRWTIQGEFINTGELTMISDLAHLTLRQSREIGEPGTKSFAMIRNPWQWYVSRYNRAVEFSTFSGSFSGYIDAAYRGDKELQMTQVWNDLTDPGVDDVGRYENLMGDLVRIMLSCWPDIPLQRFVDGMRDRGKVRASIYQHPTYRDYYTPELIEKVQEMDKGLIGEFGYLWGGIKNDTCKFAAR